jgi:hypothetical protein
MKKQVVAIALLLVFGATAHAQRNTSISDDESKIRALESAWNLAEEEKNISALDQMLAATFVYTEFDGSFSDKAQFLKTVKTSAPTSDQITNQEVAVALYGNTAVVTGIFKEKGTRTESHLRGEAGSRIPGSIRTAFGFASLAKRRYLATKGQKFPGLAHAVRQIS